MKRFKTLGGLSALTAFTALVTGCGNTLPGTPTPTANQQDKPTYAIMQGYGGGMDQGGMGQGGMDQGQGGMDQGQGGMDQGQAQGQQQQKPPDVTEVFGFLKGLNLTQEQKTQIENLMKNQKQIVSNEEQEKRGNNFLTQLSKPVLDTKALTDHFTQATKTSRQETSAAVELFEGMRDILTPSQQTAAAAAIRKAVKEGQEKAKSQGTDTATQQSTADKPPDLKMSSVQQKAFQDIAPTADATSTPNAVAAFFEKGDKAALLKVMVGDKTEAEQVKGLVAAYSGLTATQRKQIVDYSRQQAEKMKQQAQQQQQQSQQQGQQQGMDQGGMGGGM